MSDGAHTHEDVIHLPENSWYPFILAIGIGMLPFGAISIFWDGTFGPVLLTFGAIGALIGMGGWAHAMIKEKSNPHTAHEYKWLKQSVLLLLVSETAIFGALFVHHFYARWHFAQWPPVGAPEIPVRLPAIATLLLMTSSITCEFAHRNLIANQKRKSLLWLAATIILGVAFLTMQAFEYGFLYTFDKFTLNSGTFGTSFFIMTGFHGLHVAIGLVLLLVVFFRMWMGHFEADRHFSFLAASWYWHFVDIIWIFLFGTIYLLSARIVA